MFKRENILRLARLLNMPYKPSEIAEEIGVSVDTVYRSYLPAGCPNRRDASGQIWIIGVEFVVWAKALNSQKQKRHFTLEENQAWCTHCNQVVEMTGARERSVKRNLKIIQGRCALCDGKVNRLKSGKEE